MKQLFPTVWFATEKLFNNRTRLINFSDYGSLTFETGQLQFSGRKRHIRINNIQSVDIVYAHIPWISSALILVALAVFLGFWLPTLEEPIEVIAMLIPFLFIFLPYVILVQKVMLWVEIAFFDDSHILHRAYFFDGSSLGWGGILGGTLGMYKKIRYMEESAG